MAKRLELTEGAGQRRLPAPSEPIPAKIKMAGMGIAFARSCVNLS
jgi:hypothetical protein